MKRTRLIKNAGPAFALFSLSELPGEEPSQRASCVAATAGYIMNYTELYRKVGQPEYPRLELRARTNSSCVQDVLTSEKRPRRKRPLISVGGLQGQFREIWSLGRGVPSVYVSSKELVSMKKKVFLLTDLVNLLKFPTQLTPKLCDCTQLSLQKLNANNTSNKQRWLVFETLKPITCLKMFSYHQYSRSCLLTHQSCEFLLDYHQKC